MCEDDLKFAFWKLRAHLSLRMRIGYAENNVEHRSDQSWFDFFKVSALTFFLRFRVFWRFCMEQSYIVGDKRTSPPYKNRSYIHKTSESLRWKFLSALCKKTSDNECVQYRHPLEIFMCRVQYRHPLEIFNIFLFLYRHPLEIFMCSIQTLFIFLTTVLCVLFSIKFTISETIPTTVENNNWGQSLMLYSSQCSGWTAICILKQ